MLKLRIITAILLILFVLLGVYYLPTSLFSLVVLAVMLVGAHEWAGLMGLTRWFEKISYVLLIGVIGYLSWCLNLYHYQPVSSYSPGLLLLSISVIGWLVAFRSILSYQPNLPPYRKQLKIVFLGLMGIWLLLPTWLSISYLHSLPNGYGPPCVMGLLLITWIADTGAYFAGRFAGKHLLLPSVSPKKTWEGFWGGCISTGIFAFICAYFYKLSPWWYLLVAITLIYAVFGDLFESMAKRKAGVKDSGQLLPGHGGLLDRIDSLLAAAPVFALGWMIWQM